MKKLFFACLFVVGASTMSFAQGGGRPPQTPESRLERLKGAVTDITADQSTKLLAIYTAQGKSQDSLRTALNGDFGAMREKMAPITATYNAKIKAVLTADQQKAFDAMPPQGRGPGGGGPGGGGPRP
jgi:periplasmic protein CpxP/Spy